MYQYIRLNKQRHRNHITRKWLFWQIVRLPWFSWNCHPSTPLRIERHCGPKRPCHDRPSCHPCELSFISFVVFSEPRMSVTYYIQERQMGLATGEGIRGFRLSHSMYYICRFLNVLNICLKRGYVGSMISLKHAIWCPKYVINNVPCDYHLNIDSEMREGVCLWEWASGTGGFEGFIL